MKQGSHGDLLDELIHSELQRLTLQITKLQQTRQETYTRRYVDSPGPGGEMYLKLKRMGLMVDEEHRQRIDSLLNYSVTIQQAIKKAVESNNVKHLKTCLKNLWKIEPGLFEQLVRFEERTSP